MDASAKTKREENQMNRICTGLGMALFSGVLMAPTAYAGPMIGV